MMREYEPFQCQVQEDENKVFFSRCHEDTTGIGHSQEKEAYLGT